MREQLTADRLRELLHYDAETGVFTWIASPGRGGRIRVGDVAGYPNSEGYREISINGCSYRVHRVAWLYITGEWPRLQIDHANCEKADNRFCNLREATSSQNQANTYTAARNVSGFKGVRKIRQKSGHSKFQARIGINGKSLCLGTFPDLTDAMVAYNFAALKHHGRFARPDPEFALAAKQYLALRNLANYQGA
jgi:hypothetical protein